MSDFIDIVFDREPGPDSRLVDVLDSAGNEIAPFPWVKRPDGLWALRIPVAMISPDSYGESAHHEEADYRPASE